MAELLVWVIWVVAAAACVVTGVRVVTATNPFSSALSLIGNLVSLAVLYLLAQGEFVAAAQVLVYAGAVMVMFLFVIAYLGGRADAPFAAHRTAQWTAVGAAVALFTVTVVALLMDANDLLSKPADVDRAFGGPQEMGRLFLTDHLLAFEITSIVLLVAAVGGVVLGIRSAAEEAADSVEDARPAPQAEGTT
jgi:NADH:ubiquinone oxidoreductase subunit 6 (subunit J)